MNKHLKDNIIKILRATVRNIFLLINLFFVLFYILGLLSTIISPARLVFFAYFGLIFPVIVFVNVCFIIFWIIRKRKYWLISFIFLAISYSHVNNCFTIPYKKISRKHYQKEIKLLSYNISALGGIKKPNDFIDFIVETDADIVCFQEFGYYQKEKDQLKNQLLKYYPYSHIWYKTQTKKHSWGAATFSKYPIINKQKIDYESVYNISIYSDIVIDNDTIRVINNHLESNKFSLADIKKYIELNEKFSGDELKNISLMFSQKLGAAYKIRAAQAITVRKTIDSSPYKIIVCGDFNDVVESYTYNKIKGRLQDLFTSTGWGYRYSFRTNGMFVGIDHILLDQKLVPLSLEIPRKKFSDHFPIIGRIGIK